MVYVDEVDIMGPILESINKDVDCIYGPIQEEIHVLFVEVDLH